FESIGDFATHAFCNLYTFPERHATDWNERDHVGSSNAGMFSSVPSQIDMPNRHFNPTNGSFPNGFRRAGNRDHRADVVRVHFSTQDVNVTDRHDRLDDGIDHLGPPSLTKIRHTLNDSIHRSTPSPIPIQANRR